VTALLGDVPSALDRFSSPLYTVAEAARYLDVPASTLTSWAKGYPRAGKGGPEVTGSPVPTTVKSSGRGPVIPFVGLAEGLVLTAMRRAGVPLQRIRPALARLDEELGLQHALASRRLYTDGAEVLYDYAETSEDEEAARAARELVVVRSDQRVFNEVVDAPTCAGWSSPTTATCSSFVSRPTRWRRWWSTRPAASGSRSSRGAGRASRTPWRCSGGGAARRRGAGVRRPACAASRMPCGSQPASPPDLCTRRIGPA
jgi:hypothetical protein